ncbi:protein-S-isoprenylcysteine O-methyltransferase Ste14 [Cricetibacter osteomyelitidis]|uniref:Protein-S-isoprenylcysteine O-methyltransferase Ste14 n=1 Tax=Cricetibacter osteomyelitidis TaxID=1521931 RepID=A0A4R2TJ97_9PAST|nr:isoprenylcysteine carboxylmethyltransferase family protein [Cricetibacter osteomyelitidis]TCP94882.1 protein-S-isoprenylcysteine O-methyltransferase Ste14 [Cricetibacter osteomyelitidis]
MALKLPPPLVWLICALLILYSAENQTDYNITFHRILGILILLCSVVIAALSLRIFHQTQTTIDPRNPQHTNQLIQHGIFSISRNPMYLSLALALTALSFWLASAVGFIIILLFIGYITYFQIIPEEQTLQQKFGQQYHQYCRRVRRWI